MRCAWLVLAAGCSFRAGTLAQEAADGAAADTSLIVRDASTDGLVDAYPGTPIVYVQGAHNASVDGTTATAQFPSNVTAHDMLVVIASWTNGAAVNANAVTDDANNTYLVAAGVVYVVKTAQMTDASIVVFYAWNVRAGTQPTVTIKFNSTASAPELRIAEYSGIETGSSPYETSAFNNDGATSKSMDSGTVTTTNAHDLLIAANVVGDTTDQTDAAYTDRKDLDDTRNIVEDREVFAPGSYTATAHQHANSWWLFPIYAFRGAN